MSPLFAASLSLVPGVGHWAVGKRGKAVAFFAIDLGIICTVLFLRSPMVSLLTCLAYFMVMVPAVIEAYTLASGGVSQLSESKPYIVVLLLLTGFSALPFLWQSRSFSKRSKIAWSIAVPVLAILWFCFLGEYGMRLFNNAKIGLG
jgi:hypothetical protein